MPRYNRRDLFSHWIRKDEPAQRPCQHACCRGMRAHPDGYPVVKRRAYYRFASDTELMSEYARHSGSTRKDERARAQILAEAQRRDIRQERAEAADERRRARWSARTQARALERERLFVEAEGRTRGYMLNRRGLEAGVDPRSLFTGPESRARKYASEELLNLWETVPRPTEAYFAGYDTRLGYGKVTGVRGRITSEEQYARDQYERAQYNIAQGSAA